MRTCVHEPAARKDEAQQGPVSAAAICHARLAYRATLCLVTTGATAHVRSPTVQSTIVEHNGVARGARYAHAVAAAKRIDRCASQRCVRQPVRA